MEQVTIGPGRGVYAPPPGGGQPVPGVVVLHEALGLNGDIRAITERVAAMGYGALAPDLFSFGPKPLCIARAVQEAFVDPTGTRTTDDVEQARAWLAARPEVDGERIGVIGFCMGGGFAVVAAARHPFSVAATNYGRVPKDAALLDGICPVVGSFGADDKLLPKDTARRLEEALTERGVPVDVATYPGVGHSFLNRGPAAGRLIGAAYDADAAEDAWLRIGRFFAEHLDRS